MSTFGRVGRAALAAAVVLGLAACERWEKELASTNAAGTDSGDGSSWNPQLSADGTKLAFESNAANLGPTDTNGVADIYVRDVTTGVTELVSVNAAGSDAGNGGSSNFFLSADGTKVTFDSNATDLTTPAGGHGDLYIRDLVSDTTSLVSVNAVGSGGGDSFSHAGLISPDSTRVMFTSDAKNLVSPATSGVNSAFERNLSTGVTTLLADGGSAGQYSKTGDTLAYFTGGEVVLRNVATGAVTPMSAGLPGRSVFGFVAFSPDGRKVAYPRETNNGFLRSDIYVYDRVARTNTLATPAAVGAGGSNNRPSRVYGFHPTDSNRLLFSSTASNLVTIDNDAQEDVFIRDLGRRTTTLVSVNADGTDSGGGFSTEARWLGASKVAFISGAGNLGPRDTNGWPDIYVRDLTAGTTTLVSTNVAGDNAGNGRSGEYKPWIDVDVTYKALAVSADGKRIAFGSDASDLGPTDSTRPAQDHDVYVASVPAAPE